MSLKNYFDFAENDYHYFVASCERDDVANIMGAIAQGICEKYMKHIIDEYQTPANASERAEKEAVLSEHPLNRLIHHIHTHLNVSFSHEAEAKMRNINGYYFNARYPGDDSVELTKEDIEDCLDAVKICRQEVLDMIKSLDQNKTSSLKKKIEEASNRHEGQPPSPPHKEAPER